MPRLRDREMLKRSCSLDIKIPLCGEGKVYA